MPSGRGDAPYPRRGRPGRRGGFDLGDIEPRSRRDFPQAVRAMAVVLGVVAAVVVARLVWLQVVTGPQLAEEAAGRRTNAVTVLAKRGTIYDRNGNVLAMSQECRTIYCNPQEVDDPSGVAQALAETVGGDASDYESILSQNTTFAYLRRKVDTDKAEALQTRLSEMGASGVYYLKDMRRVYPYGDVASQVLGVVGSDGDGLTGLELYYDDILKGTDGTLMFQTGSGGTPIAGEDYEVQAAQDGTDIVVSIDVDVQRAAEETIREGVEKYDADSGSVMVTDPQSGEILAACSTPLFDVSDTSQIEDGALSLKPVSSSFEPGSIFKVLTMAIAIDDGLATPDTTYTVPAKVKVGDDYVGDDDGRDYTMQMTLREILRRSSNAGAATVAQDTIGADRFAEGVSRFGIGQLTGVDYPGEEAGLVKTRDQYDGASLGSMSFGQSLALPMVQMVRAVGSIANGGTLVCPHFLVSKGGDRQQWDSQGTSVSSETASQVTDMMRTVVQEGTAEAAQVEGYDIAAKTGTGEMADSTGAYEKDKYVSSLIGFAPASDAQVLVYVGLNGTPHLAQASSAYLFSTIMGEALSDMGVPPSS